ncbi:MAG: pyrroline-5-carboxylate reductase [Candidatus Magasanikbacteria bacterium CG_4_9_14_0_2_um_filter_41_10]|uniref:Pyrroline-5-carboxylate reductase n=1 Tax=Candidatus Magasanikbacteria bacterium CG_4_10_14_0_2_um_filter_41_31 TaxID=1974639 RepID=A0A2M7V3P1_9BACT|nr:MAG: pyrroline-5-carboxylate reductase [Candidatus Magasanikbacteria bacterium CG1_02_41_34]PIZ93108.1 MAG: pyrroline-5-carboxylate reductase [Candidatus Magasanikbacteria bacterium CG_4_10_14_0_2_um_filter_41_31]PJC53285.1 MAG: pyrroline-5-carboxylate reductase [Candidatus Magasanikbacteria bacterium CG_4_9_14_0_2_um_filter_41_10]
MFKKIAIIGAGNMGTILAQHACAYFVDSIVTICDTSAEKYQHLILTYSNAQGTTSIPEAVKEADVIILAVKPQHFDDCAKDIRNISLQSVTIVSIMAGVSTSYIKEKIDRDAIIRTMPNTPMQYGHGVTGWHATASVNTQTKKNIVNFLNTGGVTIFCSTEDDINKITAVSGSGPAYFFYAVECLTEAAMHLGFSREEATYIANETCLGAAAVLKEHGDATSLRERVTSKGGTTEAALTYMKEKEMSHIWTEAVKKAYTRAQELSE